MDFEKARRHEIVEYIYKKYEGRATQIAAYGYYRVSNLCNDLAKVLEIPEDEIKEAKEILNKMFPEIAHGAIADYDEIMENPHMQDMESNYKFVTHFSKMCGLIRYMGKHAAGVAITSGKLTDQIALIKSSGKDSGLQSCYDLNDLEYLKVLKIDVLGLATIDINKFVESETGETFSDKMYKDQVVLDQFAQGNTTAIFQFDKRGAKSLLCQIEADNIQDIIAANAINRPAPLQMGIPDQFSNAKHGVTETTLASRFLPDTYGCFVYQEDIITIGRKLSKMPWKDIDAVMKGLKRVTGGKEELKKKLSEIKRRFIRGAKERNPKITRAELDELFDAMTGGYLFNKGHAAGYAILAAQQMYYKQYYPLEFWCGTLRVEEDEHKRKAYEAEAIRDGVVIIPAHINGTANYEIVDFAGGQAISRGLQQIKGVGPKAAKDIEEHGPYFDKEMFLDEVTRRIVNKRVIEKLEEAGAFIFDEKVLIKVLLNENKRLYNSTLKAG